MSETNRCPQCGAPRIADQPCAACLMRLAHQASDPEAPTSDRHELDGHARPTVHDAVVPSPAEINAHFPELEVVRLLGQGGMGAVYQARQVTLDRHVALKIIHPHLANEPGFAERFAREARTLAKLNHAHILTIHDFGRRDGLCYLLMEYVSGVNLRELMRDGQLTPALSLTIARSLCEALQYAHEEGVVHRDIKPENILLDAKGRVKIADFGLAKLARGNSEDLSLTGTQQVVGTPRYMAPEQWEGARNVDHRADIYSLGVIIYELLTGELPIGRFEPPSRRAPVDARLDDVVLRALERDPQRRYQHAADVRTDLEQIGLVEVGGAPGAGRVSGAAGIAGVVGSAHPAPAAPPVVLGQVGSTAAKDLPSKEAGDRPESNEPWYLRPDAGRRVTVLALLMVAVGALELLGSVGIGVGPIVYALRSPSLNIVRMLFVVCALVGMLGSLAGIAVLVGGLSLLTRRASAFVWLGLVALVVPLSPFWLIGFPLGIFGLLVLRRPPASRDDHAIKRAQSTSVPVSSVMDVSGVLPRPRRWKTILLLVGLAIVLIVVVPAWRRWSAIRVVQGAANGDARTVSVLARLWADLEYHGADDMTPLMWAAWEGHTAIVEQLLKQGAQVDATTAIGETALMKAAYRGQTAAVRVLLERGADPARRDSDGQSALFRAVGNGHVEVVELLLVHEAPVDAAIRQGDTPLILAAGGGSTAIVELLITAGANVHARTNDGETALHKACWHSHSAVVERLLRAGAEVNMQDRDGETPLLMASVVGQMPIVTLLLEHGAEPRIASKNGLTPLMGAASNGHLQIVERLIPRSDVNQTNASGLSVLRLAVAGGHAAVCERLIAAGAREEGDYQCWQGVRLARKRQWQEALTWFEKSYPSAFGDLNAWRFGQDGWHCEIPQPRLAVALWRLECLHQLGPERAQEAKDAAAKLLEQETQRNQSIVLARCRRSSSNRTEIRELQVQLPAAATPWPWPLSGRYSSEISNPGFRQSEGRTLEGAELQWFP